MSRRNRIAIGIVVLALALRLPGLDRWPPAIHQDEASNVVDGWSLMRDGADRAGRVWPVFLQGFGAGDNRTSLYAILTIPGIALFGPGVFTARLPAALLGAWSVLALYLFARRVRGESAALWAAGLLAVNPWHLCLSRFGHEASITPAFLITALWIVSRIGSPGSAKGSGPGSGAAMGVAAPAGPDRAGEVNRRRAVSWAAAGLVLAAGLYSYPSLRLILPLTLLLAWLWKSGPKRDRSAVALPVAFVLGAVPLLAASLAHPERLLGRAAATTVLGNVEPLPSALWIVARQYVRHFLPGFLFIHGDGNLLQSPPGGELLWAELPALVLGIVLMARRRDRWDRFMLLWLLLYPAASALSLGDRPDYVPHSLRAAVGLPLFQLLGGEGIAWTIRSLGRSRERRRWIPAALGVTWAGAAAVNLAVVAILFTGSYARDVAPRYHAAYPPAVRFLTANHGQYDHLLISGRGVQQAYIYSILFGLQSPREYREGSKEIEERATFQVVRRAGEIVYFYGPEELQAAAAALRGRIWILAVAGEVRSGRVVASFPYAGGAPGLEVREFHL